MSANDAIAEIPFSYRDGLIWIEAHSRASEGALRFVLDSGASVSVLDSAVAKRLGVRLGRPVDVQGVHANLKGHWPTRLKASTGNFKLSSDYLTLDLSALSGKCAAPIDGLIGLDFFKDRVVQIDFEASVLRVLKTASPEAEAVSVALQIRRCGLRAPVTLNGHSDQWMRLDTGCVSPIQWVAPDINPEECQGRRIAVGLSAISIPETQTEVRLGSLEFHQVTTGIHSKPIFAGEAGLIGVGLLQHFKRVTIDTRGRQLHLVR